MQSDVTQIDQSPTLKRPSSGNRATSSKAAGTPAKQPVNTEGNCETASDSQQYGRFHKQKILKRHRPHRAVVIGVAFNERASQCNATFKCPFVE
jgi:hypothetical protein